MSLQDSHQISTVKVLLKKGADGTGIDNIELTGQTLNVDTYTITLTNGDKYTFDVTNGTSIADIEKTGSTGVVDTYTITLTDGSTYTFTVTNATGSTASDIAYDNTGSGLSAENTQDAIDEVSANVGALDTLTNELSDEFGNYTRKTKNNISNSLTDLPTAILEQDLEKYGYSIGDYFVGASGYTYYLADLDTYFGGYDNYAVLGTHHITLLVDTHSTSKWHTGDASSVGYNGCTLNTYLKGTVFNNIKTDLTALFGDWSTHLLSHQKLFTTALSNWGWQASSYISAPTESEVYGHREWSGNSYQEGEAVKPLAIFQKFRWNDLFGNNNHVWLRNMNAGSVACFASYTGCAYYYTVTDARSVVGLILFH